MGGRAACNHSDPAVAVVELLIREHPLALSATDSSGRNPLQIVATVCNRPAAITSLLTDATNALAASDYAALAASVHGSAFALRCLASLSYATRIAVCTSLLLCRKNVHPDMPGTPTEPRLRTPMTCLTFFRFRQHTVLTPVGYKLDC